ncbi:MAG: class I SAM-dependent methyltransferase [Bryobacteraceae bacterium]|nr:class I SAM-dependent methyltransferase [Bryobacteraceae bacterium]
MFDYLSTLRSSSWILDLGSSTGSFDQSITDAHVVRVDLDRKKSLRGGEVVQADAAALPLSDQRIDVVIANHSLEHILALGPALAEIGRIIKPGGTLFVSVPDASTLTDRIYRWLARGGGHVNPFVHRDQLSHLITTRTGLPLRATVDLYSGLSFLNRKNLSQFAGGDALAG